VLGGEAELAQRVQIADRLRVLERREGEGRPGYRDVLGFELIYKLDDWGWAELRSAMDDVNIGIGQNENIETGGGATLTFGVVDIDAARAWLEAHDVKFDGETTVGAGDGAARDLLRPRRQHVHARAAARRRPGPRLRAYLTTL